jgi:hypothetical protein
MTAKDLDFNIIDAHSHLWLRQDTVVDGQPVFALRNGRAIFFGDEVQMLPPFMVDSRNTADVFLSNMDYARVSAAVVVQEFIDGLQNEYLAEVVRGWPDRFKVCGMCDYRQPGFLPDALCLIASGIFAGMAIPGHRLTRPLNDPELMAMYARMERFGMFLSLCLHEDNHQLPEVEDIIASFPGLKIAIGHFGMVTTPGWMDQVRLARHDNVYVESGGITWLFNDEFYPFDGAVRAIRQAADEVGIEKLMWGSDYPRTITAITYRMSYDFILKSDLLTHEEKRLFLGENARRFYGFDNLIDLPYIRNMSE